MSAEVLREAAALMRSRAEAATPGPWAIENRVILVAPESVGGDVVNVILGHVNQPGIAENERNATHIASFANPAVALAVADWLDREAVDQDKRRSDLRSAFGEAGDDYMPAPDPAALAVANAYLASPPH